jgi:Trypsin-like peptidase domain
MMITLSNRRITLLAVALAAGVLAAAPAAGAVPAKAAARAGAAAPAADPRPAWLTGNTGGRGMRWAHGGTVTRSVGKVFFTLDKTDYVCTGVAVDSPHADLVLTAAHCVSDGAGRWATNWMFVPGYRDGIAPYGVYAAHRFFVSSHWPASEQYDFAFVQVTRALPARLPVAFTGRAPGAGTYVFGYPAEPPYTGLYPNYCAGRAQPAPGGSASMPCSMTAGDSGGPWFAGFRPRSGAGTVVAVSTYKLRDDMRVLYSAVLGADARSVYRRAGVSPVR